MGQNRISSFRNALSGISIFFRSQTNAKIELVAAIIVVLFGFYFKVSFSEWSLLIIAISIVLIAEIFNSSIEALSDVVSPDHDERIKKIKDMAAGGVLLAACGSALVAALVFIPKILDCYS